MSDSEGRWVIAADGLTKRYGDVEAVRDLGLHIRRGEIYGLLGPNGAGKTTTIRMLLGLTAPTSGQLSIFGRPVTGQLGDVRGRIGVVPERHPLVRWQWMTGIEYLQLFAELYRVPDSERAIATQLDRVGMADAAGRRLNACSRGMLQRLSIARALIATPEVLILDEPISGIDPHGVKEIRDLILEERRRGTTVLLSSHILSEVEKICDRVGIIDRGSLLMESTIDILASQLSGSRKIEIQIAEDTAGISDSFSGIPFVTGVLSTAPRTWELTVTGDADHRAAISRHLVENGCTPVGIRELQASLEDAYVAITRPSIARIAEVDIDA